MATYWRQCLSNNNAVANVVMVLVAACVLITNDNATNGVVGILAGNVNQHDLL